MGFNLMSQPFDKRTFKQMSTQQQKWINEYISKTERFSDLMILVRSIFHSCIDFRIKTLKKDSSHQFLILIPVIDLTN